MANFVDAYSNYYFIVLILQGICVFHSIKNGNQSRWIWIIVFLPLVGSLAYLFSEVIQKRHVSGLQETVGSIVNPNGKVAELEKKFSFSDTFTNRVALADAYVSAGMYEKAVELYEPALQGVFSDNEHVIKQLIIAYYHVGRFEDIVHMAPKVSSTLYFTNSNVSLFYAVALEKTGQNALAEKQYGAMNHRFSNYEARYYYGDFLQRQGREEEAKNLFSEILYEAQQLSRREKSNAATWIIKAKERLARLETVS